MSAFAPARNKAPMFAGVRARPGQKYAVEWVKKRLRAIYREARAAGRRSPLNEPAAHLYLLIATYVLDGRYISEPIPLQELVGVMHCESITVTRARKRLTAPDLGELKLIDGGQGKADVRFALVKMGGPLYAEQGGVTAASVAGTSITELEVDAGTSITESEATSIPKIEVGRQHRSQSWKLDADHYVPDLEEVDVPTSSDESVDVEENGSPQTQREILLDTVGYHDQHQADRFCEWWTTNYPKHNDGTLNVVRECDWEAAVTFFCLDVTEEQLREMAVACWAVESDSRANSDRSYIAQSDRSIRVMLQKTTFLQEEVKRLHRTAKQEADAKDAKHRRRADRDLPAHLERVLVRLGNALEQTSTTALSDQLAQIVAELSTADIADRRRVAARLEVLDAEMLQAARAAAAHLVQAQAEAEVADYRQRMTAEAYLRVLSAAVNRLVRERFQLPVLIWEYSDSSDESQEEATA